MGYRISCVFLDETKPRLKVNVKLGGLGEAWLYPELPLELYETIMEMADAAVMAHEAKMKAEILGRKEQSDGQAPSNGE